MTSCLLKERESSADELRTQATSRPDEVERTDVGVDEFKEVENTELVAARENGVAQEEEEADEEEEETEAEKEDPILKERLEHLKLIPEKYRNQVEEAAKVLMRMHCQVELLISMSSLVRSTF